MAPVLQCPECGARHPLDTVGLRSAFPCSGCGRTLKVPEQARTIAPTKAPEMAPAAAAAAAPAVDPDSTRVFSSTPPPLAKPAAASAVVAAASVTPAGIATPGGAPIPAPATNGTKRGASRLGPLGPVPGRWARFGLWMIAVPLAFIIVFGLARVVGLLTTNEVTDVALAEGWQRFWPIARLVPFVALLTAGLVQGGVYAIARFRAKGAPETKPGSAPDSSRRTRQSSSVSR